MLINNDDIMGYLPINHVLCVKCMQYADTANPLHICRKCAGDIKAKPANRADLSNMACKALEPGLYHGVYYPESAPVGLIRDLVRARLQVPKAKAKSLDVFTAYGKGLLRELKGKKQCI